MVVFGHISFLSAMAGFAAAWQLERILASLVPPCLHCPRFPNLFCLIETLDLKVREETLEDWQASYLFWGRGFWSSLPPETGGIRLSSWLLFSFQCTESHEDQFFIETMLININPYFLYPWNLWILNFIFKNVVYYVCLCVHVYVHSRMWTWVCVFHTVHLKVTGQP